MHYPSQTAAPSRGFPDFLLRAPAASMAHPESGSTTEVSESDEEEEEVGDGGEEGTAAAAEPVDPVLPAGPRLNASIQHAPPQEAGPSSECEQRSHCVAHCRVPRVQFEFFYVSVQTPVQLQTGQKFKISLSRYVPTFSIRVNNSDN